MLVVEGEMTAALSAAHARHLHTERRGSMSSFFELNDDGQRMIEIPEVEVFKRIRNRFLSSL